MRHIISAASTSFFEQLKSETCVSTQPRAQRTASSDLNLAPATPHGKAYPPVTVISHSLGLTPQAVIVRNQDPAQYRDATALNSSTLPSARDLLTRCTHFSAAQRIAVITVTTVITPRLCDDVSRHLAKVTPTDATVRADQNSQSGVLSLR
ncbi:hypothetical protein RRG08_029923 [Elysia crispata]|uniref:Uncharacterized protein n=1 Tax=Elysia crispata TaxID=231223 RepID=A0AAE1DH11_9GAST|nr:hypothetical protein RRG08_029923 [Elysia crispata]